MNQVDQSVSSPVVHPWDVEHTKWSRGVVAAVTVSVLVHGALLAALMAARFNPPAPSYTDESTDVQLLRPPPPPPPPPPAPKTAHAKPPPLVHPRQAAAVPLDLPAPPPLLIAPAPKAPPAPPAVPVAAAAPAAPPRPPAPVIITQPHWMRTPDAAAMSKYYPERAQRLGIGGKVTMRCKVTVRGTMEACAVLSESPPDESFGAASLKLAGLSAMHPETRDGQPVDGAEITLPIRFEPPPDEGM